MFKVHIFIGTISKPERDLGELCTVAPAVRITFLVVANYAKKKKKKNLISVAHGLRMFLVESVVISSSSSYTLLQVILPNDVLSSRKGHRHPAVNTLCPCDSKPPVESFQH